MKDEERRSEGLQSKNEPTLDKSSDATIQQDKVTENKPFVQMDICPGCGCWTLCPGWRQFILFCRWNGRPDYQTFKARRKK